MLLVGRFDSLAKDLESQFAGVGPCEPHIARFDQQSSFAAQMTRRLLSTTKTLYRMAVPPQKGLQS